MSRSAPTNNDPNPSTAWFEWDGSNGSIRHYDKEKKENILDGDKFTFILLDKLSTVRGWHDNSDSGIFSNEVRDTRAEPLVVKSFKGGEIVSGIYKDIRDRVVAVGGHFVSSLYIAYKGPEGLAIGNLQFKGSALWEWMEFSKTNHNDLYKKAIVINGSLEGKKGKIIYKTPVMSIKDISPETDKQALSLDAKLQEYLKGYFKRTSVDRSESQERSDWEPENERQYEPQRQEPPWHDHKAENLDDKDDLAF